MTILSTTGFLGWGWSGQAAVAGTVVFEAGADGPVADAALAEETWGDPGPFQGGGKSPIISAKPSLDVAIVGGGVFGLAAALELHCRGKRVGVFDIGPIPQPLAASTDVAKAVRMSYGADQFLTQLAIRAREKWISWNYRFGQTYRETGVLVFSPDPIRPGDHIWDSREILLKKGIEVENMDAVSLKKRFSAWQVPDSSNGIFVQKGGWVDSSQVVRQLAGEARRAGIFIREDFRTARLDITEGRVQGIISDQRERIVAGGAIVAAGAWTPYLLPGIKSFFRTTGQPNIYLKPKDPTLFSHPCFSTFAVIYGGNLTYGFPINEEGILKIGQHILSGEIHPESPDRHLTLEQFAKFQSFVQSFLPGLQDAFLLRTRICLYCMTQDEMFLIDRHPQIEGLAVATGGSGHAFKFAPLLGDWIADAYEGKENSDLEKFRWRLDQRT